jgi:hypothetical protein
MECFHCGGYIRNPGTPEIVEFKIQQAIQHARQKDGWDIFATSREQNLNLLQEDIRTVAARFREKEAAQEWALQIDADKTQIQNWFDERFRWPCFIVVGTYYFD